MRDNGDLIAHSITQIINELHHIRVFTERWSVDQRWSQMLTRLLRE